MTQDRNIEQQLQDLEVVPEAELLAIPAANLSPDTLVQVWTRASEAKERKAADDLAEQVTSPKQDETKQSGDDEEKRLEAAQEQFEETMREVQERSGILSARITDEQALSKQHLQELDARTIRLKDGRRVYVGADGQYVDAQGRELRGQDKAEAAELHQENPQATTWAEKTEAEQHDNNLQQLQTKVQKLRSDAGNETGQGLSPAELKARSQGYNQQLTEYEKEFQQQEQSRTAALSSQKQLTNNSLGGSDYMALLGGTSTSFASGLDAQPANGTLKKEFQSAVVPTQAQPDGSAPTQQASPKPPAPAA